MPNPFEAPQVPADQQPDPEMVLLTKLSLHIQQQRSQKAFSDIAQLFEDPSNSLVRYSIERDDESGIYTAFEQKEQSDKKCWNIEIKRSEKKIPGVEEPITFIEGVLFRTYDGSEAVDLMQFIPAGYRVVEADVNYHGFMIPKTENTSGYIVLDPNALASIGGRVVFAHELGHAMDPSVLQMSQATLISRQDFVDAIISSERRAWQNAEKFVKGLGAVGVEWLPEAYVKKELKGSIMSCMKTYAALRNDVVKE